MKTSMKRDADTRPEHTAQHSRHPLTLVTAGALAGTGVMFLWGMLLASRGGDDPEYDMMSFSVLLLASAAFAVSRRPWAPVPGTVLAIVVTFLSPLFQDFTVYHLTHPQEFSSFIPVLLLQAFGFVASVTGVAAVVRNYRGTPAPGRLPRWTELLLSVVAGAVITGLIFGAGISSGAIRAGGGSGDGSAPAGAATVEFVADDIAYPQAPTDAPAGPLAVSMVNQGVLLHNVVFEGVNDDRPVVEVGPGERATGTVALEPGDYVYYCSVPDHREAGMEGRLTVTAP